MARFNKNPQVQSDEPPFRTEKAKIPGSKQSGEAKNFKKVSHANGPKGLEKFKAPGFEHVGK